MAMGIFLLGALAGAALLSGGSAGSSARRRDDVLELGPDDVVPLNHERPSPALVARAGLLETLRLSYRVVFTTSVLQDGRTYAVDILRVGPKRRGGRPTIRFCGVNRREMPCDSIVRNPIVEGDRRIYVVEGTGNTLGIDICPGGDDSASNYTAAILPALQCPEAAELLRHLRIEEDREERERAEAERRKTEAAQRRELARRARDLEQRAERERAKRARRVAEREARLEAEKVERERALAVAREEEVAQRALDERVDALIDFYADASHFDDDEWLNAVAENNLDLILGQREKIVTEAKRFLSDRPFVTRVKERSPETYRRYLGPLHILEKAERLWPLVASQQVETEPETPPAPAPPPPSKPTREEVLARRVAEHLRPLEEEAVKRIAEMVLQRDTSRAIDRLFPDLGEDERQQAMHDLKDRLEESDDESKTFS